MEVQGLITVSREIWGDKKLNLSQIIARMGKIFGDIYKYERNEKPTDRVSEDELKKELGNMIVSMVRWCDDLGYDPEDCVRLAVIAQRKFNNINENKENVLSMRVEDLATLSWQIWANNDLNLDGIIVRMGKVFGDICRYARNAKNSDRAEGEAGLKKELGNIIFSTICWCGNLDYNPEECINIAVEAQKKYQKDVQKNDIT